MTHLPFSIKLAREVTVPREELAVGLGNVMGVIVVLIAAVCRKEVVMVVCTFM